jgi:hypothetical protein
MIVVAVILVYVGIDHLGLRKAWVHREPLSVSRRDRFFWAAAIGLLVGAGTWSNGQVGAVLFAGVIASAVYFKPYYRLRRSAR